MGKEDAKTEETTKNLPAKIATNVPAFLEDPELIKKMEPGETRVSVSAKFSINDKPVTVNTEDITKGRFVFYLTEPVIIGTPNDFIKWFSSKFNYKWDGLPKDIPPILKDPVEKLMNGEVILDSLVIDQKKSLYHFGMSLDLTKNPEKGKSGAIQLIPGVTFDGIGLMITKRGEEDKDKDKAKK